MAASKTVAACLLLTILLVGYAAEGFETSSARDLLQKKKKDKKKTAKEKEAEAEARRERMALRAYAREQEAREKEKSKVIRQAKKEAADVIVRFNKASNEKEQINVFVNLWKNAEGPTVLQALTILVSSSSESAPYYVRVVAQSMTEAQKRGYSFQVSTGLASALTLVEREEDGAPLLDAIRVTFRTRNKARKGAGCTYVRNLLTDAEIHAIQNGYEIEFTRAFDEERYLPLWECFLDTCTKDALECCKDDKAVTSGLCGCAKKDERMCDFNLFWNMPRPIWRCNGESCRTVKCLCPVIKKPRVKRAPKKDSKKKKQQKKEEKGSKKKKKTTKGEKKKKERRTRKQAQ